MLRMHFFRRVFSWLALLAVLFGAMAPTVSHALNKQSGWLEVCTAKGVKLIKVEVGTSAQTGQPAQTEHQIHFEHCPFCAPHAGAFALPSSSELVFRLPYDGTAFYPPLFFSAPQSLFVWATANPRAPPVLSV